MGNLQCYFFDKCTDAERKAMYPTIYKMNMRPASPKRRRSITASYTKKYIERQRNANQRRVHSLKQKKKQQNNQNNMFNRLSICKKHPTSTTPSHPMHHHLLHRIPFVLGHGGSQTYSKKYTK
jgi:hypothetical protein